MTLSPLFSVHTYAFAITFIVFGTDVAHARLIDLTPAQLNATGSASTLLAQVTGGQTGSIIGQPPQGRSSSIIGQPVPVHKSVGSPPNYPGTGSTVCPDLSSGRDVVRDKLDRAREDAADIDRDGRISPYEASRMPGLTVPPGATVGTPLPR